ncbi:MAG: pentapeptide repeat-containing protein [Pseudomonadota bacterium]
MVETLQERDEIDWLVLGCEPNGVGALLFAGFYQDVIDFDDGLKDGSPNGFDYEHSMAHALSRRIWNKLIGELLSDQEKDRLVTAGLVPVEELEDFTADEKEIVLRILDAIQSIDRPPQQASLIDLMTVSFASVNLPHEFILEGYVFGKLSFEDCQTRYDFSLRGSVILGSLTIKNCVFDDDADLSDVRLLGGGGVLNLSGSTFNGLTVVADATILTEAIFVGSRFLGVTSFRGTSFYDRALFHNTVFGNATDFAHVRFYREAPHFFGAQVHEDTNFAAVQWPTFGKGIDEVQNVRCYERLKLLMGSQGKFRQEHEFLRLEMKSHEAAEGWIGSLPSKVFGLFSNYGWSYRRPLFFLTLLGLFGYLAFSSIICDPQSAQDFIHDQCPRKMLGLSFSNLFSFLGLNRSILKEEADLIAASKNAEGIAVVQFILGPVFLFFFGLALRNRFRMK